MPRVKYVPEDFGKEIVAPSGYYQPIEKQVVDFNGKKLLYILGSACVDSSCCGIGSWEYVRVEGYVAAEAAPEKPNQEPSYEIDTIETESEKEAISKFIVDKFKNAKIDFR